MHQHCQNSVKTSELEDQYAIIFGLALWPQEPHEVHFFKNSWISQKVFVNTCGKSSILAWNGFRIEMTGSDLVYLDTENDLSKRFKIFPGPGEAKHDQQL